MAALSSELSSGLALAISASSSAPLLMLDGQLVVMAASSTFCDMFELDPQAVQGRAFVSVGSGEWNLSQKRVPDSGVRKRKRPD